MITFNQPTRDAITRYSGFLNEFRRWDAAFENVRGMYPSTQFASDFSALTNRYRDALERDMKGSSMIIGGFREHAKSKLWHEYAYGPSSMAMNLSSMANARLPFGTGSDRRSWSTDLDRTIEQLVVGVNLLAASAHPQPGPAPLPSPVPQPNPYPNPQPYPQPNPQPYPAPYPAPTPAPAPQPTPWPAPSPYPGDEYAG